MRSPHSAIVWQLWRRYRWWLASGGAYFVLVTVVSRLLPAGTICDAVTLYLASPLAVGLLGLLSVFAYGYGVDLDNRESGFPKRMFTLPISSRALAGWPMLYGMIAVSAATTTLGQLIIQPRFKATLDMPVWWPAVFAAGFMAWFQVVAWMPFGLRWLRLVVAVLVLGAFTAVPIVANVHDVPQWVIVIVIAIQIPVACAMAVTGVSRGRCGEVPDRQALVGRLRKLVPRFGRQPTRFTSAYDAQTWYEWRLNGAAYPVTVALMMPIPAVAICFAESNAGSLLTSPLQSTILLLLVPLVGALSISGAPSRFRRGRNAYQLSSFLATRPIDSAAMVRAKFKVAAKSALPAYLIAFVIVGLTLAVTGAVRELLYWWSQLAETYSVAEAVLILPLAVLGLLACAWTLMVSWMFVPLTGRQWVMISFIVVFLPLFFCGFFASFWIYPHPQYVQFLLKAIPWLAGSAATFKLLMAVWLLKAIITRRLLQPTVVKRLVCIWTALAAALAAIFVWLCPPGLASWHLLAAGVILTLPMIGIELAPLALAWNRHR